MTDERRAAAKLADLNIAGRAYFEAAKVSIAELDGLEWDSLPETAEENWRCRAFFREEVRLPVEALWRAGRLTTPEEER